MPQVRRIIMLALRYVGMAAGPGIADRGNLFVVGGDGRALVAAVATEGDWGPPIVTPGLARNIVPRRLGRRRLRPGDRLADESFD